MDRALAGACGFQPSRDFGLRRFDVEAVEEARIGEAPGTDIGLVADGEGLGIGVVGDHDGHHRQAIFAREVEVALVVRRTAEDRAGAVGHQHEIRDIDRAAPSSRRRDAAP